MKNNINKSNIDYIPKIKFYIKNLNLSYFRNHRDLRLKFSNKDVLLHGFNGVGKTNILEAISFLTSGRGLRKAKIRDINFRDFTRKNDFKFPWSINSKVNTPNGTISIGTGYNVKNHSRIVKVENENVKQSDLSKILKISWITPQMLLIFHNNMHEKRRFIDRLINITDPLHVSKLYKYEKLVRERSRVITDFNENYHWLDAIEKEIIKLSIQILKSRNDFAFKMNDQYTKQNSDNQYFPNINMEIIGEAEQLYNSLGQENFSKEILRIMNINKKNKTLSFPGPHKSEIIIYRINDKKDIKYSSTGEQKIILISFILKHCDVMKKIYDHPPILLLDDIIEHLDQNHMLALFKKTSAYNAQCWFTSTNPILFKKYPNIYDSINISDLNVNIIQRNEIKYA